MKKNMILTVTVLAVAVFAGLVLAFLDEAAAPHASNNAQSVAFQESGPDAALPVADSSPLPEPPSDEPDSRSEAAAPQGWLLGEHEGWLAVFPAGSETPSMIYDVLVKGLPAYDREMLANGIYAQSEAQLNLLLEDYIS